MGLGPVALCQGTAVGSDAGGRSEHLESSQCTERGLKSTREKLVMQGQSAALRGKKKDSAM